MERNRGSSLSLYAKFSPAVAEGVMVHRKELSRSALIPAGYPQGPFQVISLEGLQGRHEVHGLRAEGWKEPAYLSCLLAAGLIHGAEPQVIHPDQGSRPDQNAPFNEVSQPEGSAFAARTGWGRNIP